MPKYEIMMIVDPQKITEGEQIVHEVFGKDVKIEKLPNTQLAYVINNTRTANYLLVNVDAKGVDVKEFTRRANISPAIWRQLVVNLDSERAIKTKNAPRRERYERPFDRERSEGGPRREFTPRRPSSQPKVENSQGPVTE